jgi:hypothetical protein
MNEPVNCPSVRGRVVKFFTKLFAVAALAAFGSARADVFCNGSVAQFLVYDDGTLVVLAPWTGEWHHICSFATPYKGVSTESCYAWFSLLTAAKVHNKQIGMYFAVDTPCAQFGTYGAAPAPFYVRMME